MPIIKSTVTVSPPTSNARHRHVTLSARKDLIRSEKMDGRDYIVAPVVPLVEGVHNGEFISFEEISVFPEMWDGRPLPIDHPMDENNEPATAGSPKVMENSVVGFLFNVAARKDIRGISGEIWIDTEKASRVPGGTEALNLIQTSGELEVSTAYYCFVDNIPGEWKNPKTGKVEKYSSSQAQVRPDHLALLPYNLGACSWKDGCGAPRINDSSNDHKVDLINMADVKKLSINGAQLGKALTAAIAVHGETSAMADRLATAAGIDAAMMQSIIDGKQDFIPRQWIAIFAAVLDVDPWDLFMACSNDNSDARYGTMAEVANTEVVAVVAEEEKIVDDTTVAPVTTTHNENITASEPACGCKKTLKAKVMEILQSLGLSKAEPKEEGKEIMSATNADAKKVKVDALIASDKNKFTENHRDQLMAMSDEQIALFDLTATEAPAAATTANAQVPVVPATAAATVVETVVEKKVTPSKAELMQILGVDEETFTAARALNDQRKTARANKIKDILAQPSNKFTEGELNVFSDETIDKTLEMVKPASPFRVGAGARPANNTADEYVAPPTILLAKPGVKGVDFAVQTERNKQRGIN